jgi:hypothetical protein
MRIFVELANVTRRDRVELRGPGALEVARERRQLARILSHGARRQAAMLVDEREISRQRVGEPRRNVS